MIGILDGFETYHGEKKMDELPIPERDESLPEFVARCHADAAMLRKYPKGHDRRHAAQLRWREANLADEPEVLDKTEDPQSEEPDLPERQPQDGPGSPAEELLDP